MIDKDLIIRKQNDALIKLSILMMIADRDLHDQEYKKVIEIIEKHSMYKISEDEREMILLQLRKEMIGSAEKLDFEKAAKIRDEIENIEKYIKMKAI